MAPYVQRMIQEHAELTIRINKLLDYISKDITDDAIEYANKCKQLLGMQIYEDALRSRLVKANVVFSNGEYFESVAKIQKVEEQVKTENNSEANEKTDSNND